MSSGCNKEWIQLGKIDSNEYLSGIYDFINFMTEKGVSKKKYYLCPCRKCKNRNGQHDWDSIMYHLLTNGMDTSYTLWYHHGEDEVVNQTVNVPEPECEVSVDTTQEERDALVDANQVINDVCEEDYIDNESEVDPHKESKYERLRRLAKMSLYPASYKESKHSLMQVLVKLNDLKTEFNLSAAATEGVLGLLKELLPPGNMLGPKFYEMKCTLKEVHLNPELVQQVEKDVANIMAGGTTDNVDIEVVEQTQKKAKVQERSKTEDSDDSI